MNSNSTTPSEHLRPESESIRHPRGPQNAANQRKRRADKQMEWAKIRPIFQHLYIDLDMTLRDVIEKIDQDHGFRATEHMYKKRINAWGLSKHVKADEKETAIFELLHNEAPAATSGTTPIRHDKLIRYAKSRAKSGALDTRYLDTIVDLSQGHGLYKHRRVQSHPIRHSFMPNKRHLPSRSGHLPRSLAPPIDHANFDLFLRAMTRLIEQERREWLTGQQQCPSLIFDSLTTGLMQWRNNAFTAARQSFSHAAQTMTEDLQGIIAVSRIAYCISSIVWGSVREPVFLQFVHFMSNAALETLGPDSALTIILAQLSDMWSLDAQVMIWACAVEGYRVSGDNVHHWWGMVRRRWCWCRMSGLMDLAVRYRDLALSEARTKKLLTDEMEVEALNDFSESVTRGFKEEDDNVV